MGKIIETLSKFFSNLQVWIVGGITAFLGVLILRNKILRRKLERSENEKQEFKREKEFAEIDKSIDSSSVDDLIDVHISDRESRKIKRK